jgi:hypothetical protein
MRFQRRKQRIDGRQAMGVGKEKYEIRGPERNHAHGGKNPRRNSLGRMFARLEDDDRGLAVARPPGKKPKCRLVPPNAAIADESLETRPDDFCIRPALEKDPPDPRALRTRCRSREQQRAGNLTRPTEICFRGNR